MDWYLPSARELHASPPLRVFVRISGRDSFKGEGCDTPGVYFKLCQEIYPKLGSCLSLFIRIIHESFTKFRII
jgi:hypothetical protein